MRIENWKLHYEGFEPMNCTAPCTMLSVLLENGKIPDPFYGLNELDVTDYARKDCTFTSEFTVAGEDLSKQYQLLTFQGLDTICDIYLNGTLLGKVKNMHRSYSYQVKELLRPGTNEIRLDFKSPIAYFEYWHKKHYIYCNDGDTIPGAAHLRKALYQSGWDWGPTLPDMGIYREVELTSYNVDRIESTNIRQNHKADGSVDVTVAVLTENNAGCDIYVTLDGQRVKAVEGKAVITVQNPKLWWIRGFGEQPLYDVDVELMDGDTLLDSRHKKIGLRTLTVSTEKDADKQGSEFAIVINGVKIFAMGGNYIPQDNLLTRVTKEKMDEMITWALDANFNSLRVWGGGYYPDSYFYELCDKHGIVVWQDFMVACANIYLTREMEEEFRQEAVGVLKRLHHHACLGILAGNNEMEAGVLDWGARNNQLVRDDYIKLYEHILAELSEEYAPGVFYWPSSPSSGGGFDDPSNPAKGDTHYWEVWHGGVPFTTYRQRSFRFCSEYGFESFPSMKTIRSFCPESERNCFSRVMENHQKCKGGNGKILRYLADNYLYPYSFENLVYASQLLQADAIKYGVEHFRRQRGYCMGSIYWQFNDCWPVASWSSVDCYGRYKALHYAARKFYAPVAMGLFLEGKKLTVNVSNETMFDFKGSIKAYLCRNDMTVLEERERAVEIERLESADVYTWKLPDCDIYTSYLYVDLLDENGNLVMRQVEMMVPPKHFTWLKPGITTEFADTAEGVTITLTTDVFAKGVFLDFEGFDCVLSDNFFSLTNGEPYQVTVRTDRSAEELKAALLLKTVYDIR